MNSGPDYDVYAGKMRGLVAAGTDMEVEVRFVDMIAGRSARILDVGCGIGNAVNGLRSRGHLAFGIDPTPAVLAVAEDLYDRAWFRRISAVDLTPDQLADSGLPTMYDVILMSGNVSAFLTSDELAETMMKISSLLAPGGALIIGTTTSVRGGPADQERASARTDLTLSQQFSDWHFGPFLDSSPWSVSVYLKSGTRPASGSPDGIFVLKS